MPFIVPFLPAIGAVVGAVGAGLSFVAQRSAADTAETLAASNATSQLQAINQQRQTSQMAAAINGALARKDQDAANASAAATEGQAAANSAASREAVRFSRLNAAKMAAANRAAMGKGSVDLSTGSTLALMAANKMESENAANNIVFEGEGQRRALFQEADAQRNQGVIEGMKATGQQIAGVAAANTATQAAAQAKLDLYGAQAAASAARTNAGGNLFTSFGGLAMNYAQFKKTPGAKPVYPKAWPTT